MSKTGDTPVELREIHPGQARSSLRGQQLLSECHGENSRLKKIDHYGLINFNLKIHILRCFLHVHSCPFEGQILHFYLTPAQEVMVDFHFP